MHVQHRGGRSFAVGAGDMNRRTGIFRMVEERERALHAIEAQIDHRRRANYRFFEAFPRSCPWPPRGRLIKRNSRQADRRLQVRAVVARGVSGALTAMAVSAVQADWPARRIAVLSCADKSSRLSSPFALLPLAFSILSTRALPTTAASAKLGDPRSLLRRRDAETDPHRQAPKLCAPAPPARAGRCPKSGARR